MTITVEMKQVAGRAKIALTSNERSITNKCKAIPGSKPKYDENGDFLFWHFPLDMTTAHSLRAAFPRLVIGPRLTEWAKYEQKQRKAIGKLHILKSCDPVQLKLVPIYAPTIWAAMCNRGFQTIVPAFASQVGRHFNADQPGCGKTIEELGALVECGIRGEILVVAPRKALRATWLREINKWLGPDFRVQVTVMDAEEGTMIEREEKLAQAMGPRARVMRKRRRIDFHFVLVNPEMLRWNFACPKRKCNGNKKTCDARTSHTKEPQYPTIADHEWDAVLADETHKYMMHANERSGSVSEVGYGFQKLMAKPRNGKPYKVGMSGTPFKGKTRKFFDTLRWMDKKAYSSAGRWSQQYFVIEPNTSPFGSAYAVKVTDEMREDRRKHFEEDLNMIMVRRTKRELHAMNPEWAPPDKLFVDVMLPMDMKQRKAYQAMERNAVAKVNGGHIMANGILAEFTRLKQLACAYGRIDAQGNFHPALPSNKWDWIKNVFLAERGILDNDGEIKVGIGSQFVELLDLYSAQLTKLKVPHFYIKGSTTDVEAIQDRWMKPGGPRVVLISTNAGGVSLTLDSADDVVVDDETWVPDEQEQMVDRFHRTSRTDHQVTVYRLISEGTIDERIAESGDAADEIQKRILDGRRGVSFAKSMLLDDDQAA